MVDDVQCKTCKNIKKKNNLEKKTRLFRVRLEASYVFDQFKLILLSLTQLKTIGLTLQIEH